MATFEEAASIEASYLATKSFQYGSNIIIRPLLGVPSLDKETMEDIWNGLSNDLKAIDEILSTRKYLAGPDFTLADVWSMPWVFTLIDLKGGPDGLFSDLPHLKRWWDKVSVRPAWQEASKLMHEALEAVKENAGKSAQGD
ncbi:putative glutathione S-transferase [Fusarium proliferatum ET1]|uniref:glutathione transferase n=1 Tax=Fusarium proliferatum (strain ET1) TaxID=1227346 RepID=A0A1L7VV25_FUSPR|nr:putative glutathione S-transferase [Fusarium proliferatum ET1]CZR43956.1 probable glutathione S-transferase [Fusarium proliferatum ET1]